MNDQVYSSMLIRETENTTNKNDLTNDDKLNGQSSEKSEEETDEYGK